MPNDRAESAYRFRLEAAELARHRAHPEHEANPDEARYGTACYLMNFTKGLRHDKHTGLVKDTSHFEAFRTAIDNAFVEPFTTRVPVPRDVGKTRRLWEAPTAGVVHELEGPDPQAVTMPPAPELGSDELTYEMAEVYELALLRDVPFSEFVKGSGSPKINDAIGRMDTLEYAKRNFPGSRGRKTTTPQSHDSQTLFRGSSPGVEKGPYLSQFLLIGTRDRTKDGLIDFGAQTVDQRVLQAKIKDDYMANWNDWLHVQNGFAPKGKPAFGQDILPDGKGLKRRLICTPRDLATYVHVDALYQAYLNACLILIAQNASYDPSFGLQSGQIGEITVGHEDGANLKVNAGGFALYGGPHILSLVTEVATRGLKAVRYQKFNVHLRLRPEALAARIVQCKPIEDANPSICGRLRDTTVPLRGSKLLDAIEDHNAGVDGGDHIALLPMAFAEGSPMHPTYGAGHATVAGACVTMLKAFFDTSAVFVVVIKGKDEHGNDKPMRGHFWTKDQILAELLENNKPKENGEAKTEDEKSTIFAGAFVPHCHEEGDTTLEFENYGQYFAEEKEAHEGEEPEFDLAYTPNEKLKHPQCPLTLEGELNKLCANISIGRNMAGVHYYSDYYDSARMGEEVAIGILEEQALGYPTDKFVLSLPTFDGESRRIGRR